MSLIDDLAAVGACVLSYGTPEQQAAYHRLNAQVAQAGLEVADAQTSESAEVVALIEENARLREVVQAVAASDPMVDIFYGMTGDVADTSEVCVFCHEVVHNEDCTWLRARNLLGLDTQQ